MRKLIKILSLVGIIIWQTASVFASDIDANDTQTLYAGFGLSQADFSDTAISYVQNSLSVDSIKAEPVNIFNFFLGAKKQRWGTEIFLKDFDDVTVTSSDILGTNDDVTYNSHIVSFGVLLSFDILQHDFFTFYAKTGLAEWAHTLKPETERYSGGDLPDIARISDKDTGLFGVGVEIPFNSKIALRLEYMKTASSDYPLEDGVEIGLVDYF